MTFKSNQLRDAIKVALCVGATSMMGAAFAQDTATPPPPVTGTSTDASAKNLDTITVTGSRVRRVEKETANPVVIIDRQAIERTGKLTIGEVVQELPNISGAPTTTAVNNGGGGGFATAELRGLGSQRTLVLIDGRRPGPTPVDLNSIPLELVERIEVLTEGASTIYGSDAIGGVINFIMRKNYQGAQASINYGITGHNDGQRSGISVIGGQSGDKGNFVAGVEYNKFEAISSARRNFAKDALYLSYGSVQGLPPNTRGSSRNPFGRINFPSDSALNAQFGCTSVTRIAGAPGGSLADYRCYQPTDAFNYQRFNAVLTPQERTNAFALGTFNLTDKTSAFLQIYHQKQTAQSQIAPLPFDAQSDNVTVSADNLYNPFGISFGQPTADDPLRANFRSRFTSLGQRIFNNSTANDVLFAGLKGSLGQTWNWYVSFNYNHSSFVSAPTGYVFYQGLRDALGPSFLLGGPGGVPTCGTAAAPIANCTPLNIFNIDDPNTIAALKAQAVTPINPTLFIQREVEFNANGDLFDLPAGTVKLAVGGDSRREYQNSQADFVAKTTGADGTCFISQEACTTPLTGGFSLQEVYAEAFIPILKEIPGIYALNLDVGSRFSKYSSFGSTTNNKLSLEYRPIKDLLLRGSASDLFRAPTTNDLFAGSAGNAPQATDPCVGFPVINGSHIGCLPATGGAFIPPGGIVSTGLGQTTGVTSGSVLGGIQLKPEQGRSYDFGFVYDPEFVPGLSVSADYYRVQLSDVITALGAQTALNACFSSAASPFCPLIHRNPDGQIAFIQQPTVNLGSLVTSGIDTAVHYRLPAMRWGQFNVSIDATHINKYDVVVDPNDTAAETLHIAGHYNKDFGNYMKWRGNAALSWTLGDFNAGYRLRWVGKGQLGDADVGQGTSADAVFPGAVLHVANYFESFITAGYNFKSINSRIDLGVDNLFDKQPQLFYQNNVLNSNVDVSTYDTVGRLYWTRFTVKF